MDYCNCLLMGLPDSLLKLIQRVQNCAARLIKCLGRSCHITPILKELHWLPVRYRIKYKIILLTFKALNNLAPSYILNILQQYQPNRTLRSVSAGLLQQPTFHYVAYGGRCFATVAPQLWNDLPPLMRSITSLSVFKRTLKTYLFNLAFDSDLIAGII